MQKPTKSFESEEIEEVSLGDLLYKFLPYWPFFYITVINKYDRCMDLPAL